MSNLKRVTAVLDTECTGLGKNAQVVEVSLVCVKTGKPLFNTLVKPTTEIEPAAEAVHGISAAMVEDAPSWESVSKAFAEAVSGHVVGIYGEGYDTRMLRQTAEAAGVEAASFESVCIMQAYADAYGQIKEGKDKPTWQSLDNALDQQGLSVDAPSHRAEGDCHRTIAVLNALLAGNIKTYAALEENT